MSHHFFDFDDISTDLSSWGQGRPPPDDEGNDHDYAVSHDGGDFPWFTSPPARSPVIALASNAIPISNFHETDIINMGFGYSSHSHGASDSLLAGMTASPVQQTFGSWPETLVSQPSIGSVFDPDGTAYSSLTMYEGWGGSANVSAMLRTDSGSSQGIALPEDLPLSYDVHKHDDQLSSSFTGSDMFNMDPDDADTVQPSNNTKGSKGRVRSLTEQQRHEAGVMRRLGACKTCNRRKIKCDPGIPCKKCVTHWGEELRYNPCRGEQLHGIADCMISENAFPRGNPLRFLPDGWAVDKTEVAIRFDLGFGIAKLHLRCNPLIPPQSTLINEPIMHTHTRYAWPPRADASDRGTCKDLVFPVILAEGQNLEDAFENYLRELLRHENFRYFPLFQSQLNVLMGIYWYFRQLPVPQTQPLEAALKLLILVHMAGDLAPCRDHNSAAVLSRCYGSSIDDYRITACFVRSQLGPIFSKIAHKLMRSVLKELETLSQVSDHAKFPNVVGSFSVLAMTLESLQYHVSKLAYHSPHDTPSEAFAALKGGHEPNTRELIDPGHEVLLRFYKGTACHAKLGHLGNGAKSDLTFSLHSLFARSAAAGSRSRTNSTSSNGGNGRRSRSNAIKDELAIKFMDGIHNAVGSSREYLYERAQLNTAGYHDMTAFFDRLLARMYLLD